MVIELKKVSSTGDVAGTVEVNEAIFGVEPNLHVLHLAVRRELANARAGTANSKTRSEVRGGGRKPWKQKGTGRARAGSIRSPLWRGGGVIFGPKPRDFSINLPKKVRVVAIRSSLSNARGKFHVVDDFSFLTAPKTKAFYAWLSKMGLQEKKVLILAHYKNTANQHLVLSTRNLPSVKVSLPHNLSVKDLLHVDAVIATQEAVDEINTRYATNG